MTSNKLSFKEKVYTLLIVIFVVTFAILIAYVAVDEYNNYFGDDVIETTHDPVSDEWKVLYECRSDWVVIGAADTEDEVEALAEELAERDDLGRFCDIRSSKEVNP